MARVVSRVESYIKKLRLGTVFTFDTVFTRVGAAQKDTVNHALKKLTKSNEIVHVKKGVYLRPKMSRFGAIPVEPGKVVKVTAKNNVDINIHYSRALKRAEGTIKGISKDRASCIYH